MELESPDPQEEGSLREGIGGSGLCVLLSATRDRPSLRPVCRLLELQSLMLRVGLRTP